MSLSDCPELLRPHRVEERSFTKAKTGVTGIVAKVLLVTLQCLALSEADHIVEIWRSVYRQLASSENQAHDAVFGSSSWGSHQHRVLRDGEKTRMCLIGRLR